MGYTKSRRTLLVMLLVGLLILGTTLIGMANDLPNSVAWDGQGSDSLRCDKLGESPERTEDGWMHWIITQGSGVTEAELVLGGSGSGTYAPSKYGPVVEFFTPYFDVDTLTATLHYAGTLGGNSQFTLSDYCPGVGKEELTVSKTVDTSFVRTHDWSIDKSVETENEYELNGFAKIWLFADGSGDETATWQVDVTYEGFEDDDFNVSGTITIENTGTLDAVVTGVVDKLAGTTIDVDWEEEDGTPVESFPFTLEVGKKLIGFYDEDVASKIEGFNKVEVTTERDVYKTKEAIIWGEPDEEINKTVNIKDISDLFGEVDLGEVTAPNNAQFTYDKHFAWEDFDECGSFQYDNTATIVETGQEADATLKVNVQCLIFKGETAWAANGNAPLQLRYNQRGNWATYVQYAEKTTTLFAGQTIPVGTVHFSAAVNGQVTITVNLTGDWKFEDVSENLKVQDYASAPSGNPAVGRFAHKKTVDIGQTSASIIVPANNFYGVHVNVAVGMPDPNFGP